MGSLEKIIRVEIKKLKNKKIEGPVYGAPRKNH